MIMRETDENGYKTVRATTSKGGRVSITEYGKDSEVDIGGVSIMNEHGLGGRNWIRDINDIENHIKRVRIITWITQKDKDELIEFLNSMKN